MSDDIFNFKEVREVPHFTDDRGFTYYLHKKTEKKWVVKKVSDDAVTIYEVDYMQGRWICDCPAGFRGNRCKHSTWITELAKVL